MSRDLAVIAFDGVHLASVGLFLDLFDLMRRRVAEQFKSRDDIGMHTRTRLLGQSARPVRVAGGRRLEVDESFNDDMEHLLIHVPDFEWPEEEFTERLHEMRGTVDWLARQHAKGAHLSATGRGIHLLAEAGLLGKGPIPLSRSEAVSFRLRHPRLRVDTASEILELGRVTMARGVAHEMTMLMRLIARLLSSTMAGSLAEAMGRGESREEGLSDDPLVAAAQVWLAEHASRGARIADLALHLAVSQQTLIRHFHAKLGMTPRNYLRMLRVKSAEPQLRETRRPISQIATLVGYDDLKSFQNAFRTYTGMSASRYRAAHRADRRS